MFDHRPTTDLQAQETERHWLLSRNALIAFAWPVVCLILCVLLWAVTHSMVAAEKRGVEDNALRHARLISAAYAERLHGSIEQIDHIAKLVRHEWEVSEGSLRLDDSFQIGLFSASQYLYVMLIDRDGNTLARSSARGRLANVADRDYFIHQQSADGDTLFIGRPVVGRSTGKTVIHFSRRLVAPDNSFAGVVVVGVEPSYFASIQDYFGLGKNSLLAMADWDGVVRALSRGGVPQLPDAGAQQLSAAFPTSEGVSRLRKSLLPGDGQPWLASWHGVEGYPMVAVVGVAEEELFAAHRHSWANYRNYALAGSSILVLFALVATLLSLRLAWRQHHAENARQAYGVVTEGGSDGFYHWRAVRNRKGRVIDFEVFDCNARGAAFYGLDRKKMLGTRLSNLYRPPYLDRVVRTYSSAMESGYYEDEYLVPKESLLKMAWVHRKIVRSGVGVALMLRDISEMKAHEMQLVRLANHDALTGLPNRNWIMNHLPGLLCRAAAEGTRIDLFFIDLDNFKELNDALGHAAGDDLLRMASERLAGILREEDSIVRLGGDEFVLLAQALCHDGESAAIAEEIIKAFRSPFQTGDGSHLLGASIGIAAFPRDAQDSETLLKNADIAMYAAKSRSKGNFAFFDPDLYRRLKDKLDTKQQLVRALEQDEFVVYFQPRVRASTGELCGMEALLRWDHPRRGIVSPLEFVPLAEDSGLIMELGDLVIEKVCHHLSQWAHAGLPRVPVSLNVSARQINQGVVKDALLAGMARHRIEPCLIEIEITESVMMESHREAVRQLWEIRQMGIKLLVDDFGTGYSSLAQLQRLDMDVLKVDRAFTAKLGKGEEGGIFFQAIISMARALGMTVVAEGVETIEQLETLQSLGCDELQGHLISRPVPAAQVPAILRQQCLLPGSILA